MANRNKRVHALIQKNLSEILQFELKNSSIGFVSVTDTIVNRDNSFVKVYVSFLGKGDKNKRFEALNRCKGFIRSELAKRLDIYKVPEISFVIDETFENAKKLEASLAREKEEIAHKKKLF